MTAARLAIKVFNVRVGTVSSPNYNTNLRTSLPRRQRRRLVAARATATFATSRQHPQSRSGTLIAAYHPASGYRTVIELPTRTIQFFREPQDRPRSNNTVLKLATHSGRPPFPFSKVYRPIRLQFKLSPVGAGSQASGASRFEQEASTSCERSLCYCGLVLRGDISSTSHPRTPPGPILGFVQDLGN
jgi:hypothetical protein